MKSYQCKYDEDCNGCYFKETSIAEDKYKECWDCVPIIYIDSTDPAVPSNYVSQLPYQE